MQPLKALFKSTSLLVVLNLILKPLWIFVIDRKVQLVVGQNDYGHYYSLYNLAIIFSVLLDFGIGIYFTANFTASETQEQQKQFWGLFRLKALLSILYAIALIVIALLAHIPITGVFVCILIAQIVNYILLFLRNYFTTNQQFSADAIISVIDKLAAFLVLFLLLYTTFFSVQFTITHYVLIPLICTAALAIYCFMRIYKKIQTIYKKTNLKKHFIKALPYAIVIFLMSILLRNDVLLLKFLHKNGDAEVAEYAYGYRILDALNTFGFLFAAYLFPFLCKHILEREMVQKTVRWMAFFLLSISIGVLLIVFLFKKQLVQLLYHQEAIKTQNILLWCCAAFVGCCLVHIYSSVLTAHKKINHLICITAIFVCLSTVANYQFIPQYGATASALTCCFIQLLYGFTLMFFCYKLNLLKVQPSNSIA